MLFRVCYFQLFWFLNVILTRNILFSFTEHHYKNSLTPFKFGIVKGLNGLNSMESPIPSAEGWQFFQINFSQTSDPFQSQI